MAPFYNARAAMTRPIAPLMPPTIFDASPAKALGMGEPVAMEVKAGMVPVPAAAVLSAERVTRTGVDATVALDGQGE